MDYINATVFIKKNSTGEVRQYDDKFFVDGYIWSDGNYSCDCNRELFFLRANGDPEDHDTTCGHSAYSVFIVGESGDVLYSEFEKED